MGLLFPVLYYILPLFICLDIAKKYQLSKRRIAILFFLAPLVNIVLVELYTQLMSNNTEAFDPMIFAGLSLFYLWLFLPLLLSSTLMVYIQKIYAPTLLKQLGIIAIISVIAVALFLFFIHKPLLPSLLAPIIGIITVSILFYFTDVVKIVK